MDLRYATLGRKNTNITLSISQDQYQRCTEIPDDEECVWETGEGAALRELQPSGVFVGTGGKTSATKNFGFKLKNIRLFKYDDYTGNAAKELLFSEATSQYPIKIYEGIPLTHVSANGSLTISEIIFSAGGNKIIAFNNGPFDDDDAKGNLRIDSASGSYTELVSGGKYYYTLGPSTELKDLVFKNVSSDTTIYVKMYDSNISSVASYCTMNVTGDIILTKND